MRILVLSDIHANWQALNAIQEKFDACLFVGDLVDYGPDPVPCIEWVKERATASVRGNHDHAVAQRVNAPGGWGFRALAAATRPLQWRQLQPPHMKFLARLPVTQTVQLDGLKFHLVHATPRDPMDEYLMPNRADWERRVAGIDADFVCVGHTHVQFHLELTKTQVLNPGSVGQPRDRDSRAAYAVIEDGKVELRRIEYPIDLTVERMREVGFSPDAIEIAEVALRTGGKVPRAAPEEGSVKGTKVGSSDRGPNSRGGRRGPSET